MLVVGGDFDEFDGGFFRGFPAGVDRVDGTGERVARAVGGAAVGGVCFGAAVFRDEHHFEDVDAWGGGDGDRDEVGIRQYEFLSGGGFVGVVGDGSDFADGGVGCVVGGSFHAGADFLMVAFQGSVVGCEGLRAGGQGLVIFLKTFLAVVHVNCNTKNTKRRCRE